MELILRILRRVELVLIRRWWPGNVKCFETNSKQRNTNGIELMPSNKRINLIPNEPSTNFLITKVSLRELYFEVQFARK